MQLLMSIAPCLLYWAQAYKHLSAVEFHHASFTTFIESFDGALGHEALMFLQHLDDRLSGAWGKNYSHVLMWIKVHLAFAVV